MLIEQDAFKAGMRRLAAGVSIITTELSGKHYGLACTSVTSVTLEPPTLLVCINKSASAHDQLVQAGKFCVNILSPADRDIAMAFSRSEKREERFSHGRWSVLETGAPALCSALASFDCRVSQAIKVGTHTICIGEILVARASGHPSDPLIYFNGAFAGLAAI